MRSLFLTALLCVHSTKTESVEEDVLPREPSGEVDAGCETDEDCAAYEICEEEECTTGDRSDGFSDAGTRRQHIGRGQLGLRTHQPRRQGLLALRLLEVHRADRRGRDRYDDALVPDLFLTLDPDGLVVTGADGYANKAQSLTPTLCCTRT